MKKKLVLCLGFIPICLFWIGFANKFDPELKLGEVEFLNSGSKKVQS